MKKRVLALVLVLAALVGCAPSDSGDEDPIIQDGVTVPGEQ